MKLTLRAALLILVVLFGVSSLVASGRASIYGIVTKVVLEPNDKAPERIQIWGAFTLADGEVGSDGKTLTPQKGYLYFELLARASPAQREAALKEWADFKAIAGTGQAVAFGGIGYIGVFSDELITRPAEMPPYVLMPGNQSSPSNLNGWGAQNPIRSESAVPAGPSYYPLDTGLTKLARTGDLAAVVQKLEAALKK